MFASPTQSLLRLDPDLGQFLPTERLRMAEQELVAGVVNLAPGACAPHRFLGARSPESIGVLVVSGAIAREVRVYEAPSAELFGPGDIIRVGDATQAVQPASINWATLGGVSVALMGGRTATLLRRYPEVMAVVLDRLNARAERLAVTQAISQITGVDTRIEAMLWHLSERWGRVGKDGVVVTLALSHRMLGALVGARRPTVSTAVSRLANEGRVTRQADGTWLLSGYESPIVADASSELHALGSSHIGTLAA
jgi:CRP/FNR family transcriptional regulator, cyclic AMP receptor protein